MRINRSDFTIPDEDSDFLCELNDTSPRPIFIMGLHRSGTTFLYESLARLFPLAPLTAYHIIFYKRLLSQFTLGRHRVDQAKLDRYFSERGVHTRQIDDIKLSHRTVEEYCWLLKKHAGSVHLNKQTVNLFEEMCRKLLYMQAGSETVLMKNPWDTSAGPEISTFFPESRFIYISRDPIRVLNSQLKNCEMFASGETLYLDLLVQGFPLAKLVFFVQRILYRALGARLFRVIMTRRLKRDMIRELKGYKKAIEGLSSDVSLETSYEELSERPAETLKQIGDFLGLTPRLDPNVIKSRPRTGELLPEVEAVRAKFTQKLEELDLIRGNDRLHGVATNGIRNK